MAWVNEINTDRDVDRWLAPGTDGALVWIGTGLPAVGLEPGALFSEEHETAARRLMKGCHPQTGAPLFASRASVRAHRKATLAVAPLLRAIEEKAAAAGVEPGALLEGKPKQQKTLAGQQRLVIKEGETQRLNIVTVHKLARAVGIDLPDVYGRAELETAWRHKDLRVDSRVPGWCVVLDLPKSDSVLAGLLPERAESEYRLLVQEARADTLNAAEQLIGYAVRSQDGDLARIATQGLLGWSSEHRAARPMGDAQPGDPHLRLHVVLANLALCEDGTWRSIANSGMDLYRHASVLDAFFKARVRLLALQRFGVRRVRSQTTGAWEVEGISRLLCTTFSRRAQQVNEDAGAGASVEDKRRVSAWALRFTHAVASADTMRESWRQRAEAAGIDVDAMVAGAAPGPGSNDSSGTGPRIPPPDQLAALVLGPGTGLTGATKGELTRAELMAAVANALPYGFGTDLGELQRLADDVLRADGYTVALPHRGSTLMSSTARYGLHHGESVGPS
ncbi:relaxase domain-containing protein [Streptomyces sp. NPDC050988]|uniref:relaxase domain-containing protein n=1 Tax=Streptomyces sp. NPDC050988 TaxID=3365637 RepID=UPI0037941497